MITSYVKHFHPGTLSRRSDDLETICPGGIAEISPEDAAELGIAEGDKVEVRSRRGQITTEAQVTPRSPVGTVFVAFHFREAAANVLTNDALDPSANILQLKVCAVSLKKVG